MDQFTQSHQLESIPQRLFFSALPTGEHEFSCFVDLHEEPVAAPPATELGWSITEMTSETVCLTGRRRITPAEDQAKRFLISALLPPGWGDSHLRVDVYAGPHVYSNHWTIAAYQQHHSFTLPLAGQILVLIGHRVGEAHRSAWQVPSQQFAWDLLPLDSNGLRLLTGSLTESLRARDFVGFGCDVMAPAQGCVVRVADGLPDHEHVSVYPEDMRFYLEDLRRAAGNHVIIDHGDSIYSCLAHLQHGSITAHEGQVVETDQVLGALGNSGFSSGPHLHLHFMDGPDILLASSLPIVLQAEGHSFAPQAGNIISR